MRSSIADPRARLDALDSEMKAIVITMAVERRLTLTPAEEQRYAALQAEHDSLNMAAYLETEQRCVERTLRGRQ